MLYFSRNNYRQRPAGSRSAGFTCSYLCLPLSLIGLVNACLRKPPALLGCRLVSGCLSFCVLILLDLYSPFEYHSNFIFLNNCFCSILFKNSGVN